MSEQLVVGTEVTRREDGCVLTLHYEDGSFEERYLSPMEIQELHSQLEAALAKGSGR